MPEELYPAQVDWVDRTLMERRRARTLEGTDPTPTLIFVHIPLWEFEAARASGKGCFGTSDDGVTPTINNTGLFQVLQEAPEVLAVFVGHDHCN